MMKKRFAVRMLPVLIAVFAMLVTGESAWSQQAQPRIAQAINNQVVVRVPRTHHPLAAAANDRGRMDGGTSLERMVLVLKPGDQQTAALTKAISGLQDKQSPSYHHWLTPEQFASQFGPAQQDLDQITSWLQQQGFRVDNIARGKQWIEFSGNAAQVENAFHTEMHRYIVKGEDHVGNATDISLPRALTPVIAGVLTLHDFRKQSAHGKTFQLHRDPASGKLARIAEFVPTQNGVLRSAMPEFTLDSSTHFLTPGDYARIYNTRPLLTTGIDGTSVSIAVVGRTDINLSDVQTFRQIFGLPANDPQFVVNGPDPGVNGDEVESALDVEWSGAVAPKATIKFVTTRSTFTTDGIDLSTSYVIDNVVAPIMSSSYGLCEAFLGNTENAFLQSIYQQAAAEGITVLVSSGDNGPAVCDLPVQFNPAQNGLNVSGLASTPYNVAVGGTQLHENGSDSNYWLANNRSDLSSAIGYIPESVWNESCDPTTDPTQCDGTWEYMLWSGSGGASSCTQSTVAGSQITCIAGYPKPSWQAGVGVVNDGARDLPDVSLTAAGGHDGYLVCLEGSCQTTVENGRTVLLNAAVIGGTSASTPSMAGMMALVEQKNGSYQGLINYSLYQLASAEKLSGCNSSNLTDPKKSSNCIFYDVTSGNNNVPGQTGFNAVTGHDMVSGLGSVNASNLAKSWNSVQKLASTATLTAATNAVQHGAPLPVNVAVSPVGGGGAPSGDVSLISNNHGSIFGGTLSNGMFSGGVNGLAGGHYTISAHYSGDAMFSGSTSKAIPVTITPEASVTRTSAWVVNLAGFVVPIYGPINYGQPLALQINAQGKSGVGSATGKATVVLDNTTSLGSFPLNAEGSGWVQVDNLTKTGLTVGPHSFVVNYSGDNSFEPSHSNRIAVSVRKVLTNGFASSIPTTVTVGTPVRLSFSVLSEGVLAPTGTVNLYDNNKKIAGPMPLRYSGPAGPGLAQVNYTASGLEAGFHYFQLTYGGDANHLSLPLNTFSNHGAFVTVNAATGAGTHVGISPSASSVSVGESVTYSVSVAPIKPGALPTGTISLVGQNGGPFTDPVALSSGTASITLNWVFAAQNAITAEYSGDTNYSASNSAVIVTKVSPGTPTVTLTPAASSVSAGTQTSLTVTTLGYSNPNVSLPYGEVSFFDSVNGGPERMLGDGYLTTGNGGNPIFTLPVVLPGGNNVIQVKYRGTQDWKPTVSNSVAVAAE